MCHNLKHLLITVNVQVVTLVEVQQVKKNPVTEREVLISSLVESSVAVWDSTCMHERRTEPDRICFP